eukprot:14884688-Heterocapsa_arctica.AAC.1
MEAKSKLTEIGQVLNDKKEQTFAQSKSGEEYDIKTAQTTKTESSLNKKKRIDDTVKVVKKIQYLGLSVRDKINIIKAAGRSRATYGAAVDPFT